MKYTILYRGKVSSCNYLCPYCPFTHETDSPEILSGDREDLNRFVTWAANRAVHNENLSIFFTPRGEVLTRSWYCDAIAELSSFPHIEKIAVQTNLSASLDWLKGCCRNKLALWTTYHPSQVLAARYLEQCRQLDDYGISYSVGIVGIKEHKEEIARMRADLPSRVYLWINAYKDEPRYYSREDLDYFRFIDPLFTYNSKVYKSKGKECRTGDTVISVYSDGSIQRCHFTGEKIGNIYQGKMRNWLRERICTNQFCECHIGYVHMHHLGLYDIFGDGVLERVPVNNCTRIK
ncbi:MAG: radical SAM protein [bacterium]|nr:radical SAM protein [bacterium]